MNILLNIFGIGFVAYAVILLIRNSNSKSEDEDIDYMEFANRKEDEEFNAEEFMEELNSFSKVLNDKQEDQSVSKYDNNSIINNKQDIYTPSGKIEKEIDKSEDPGYSSLVRDISQNKNNKKIDSSNNEVISLKEIGLSNNEIAKRTNRSVREIEVILKIYNKNK